MPDGIIAGHRGDDFAGMDLVDKYARLFFSSSGLWIVDNEHPDFPPHGRFAKGDDLDKLRIGPGYILEVIGQLLIGIIVVKIIFAEGHNFLTLYLDLRKRKLP